MLPNQSPLRERRKSEATTGSRLIALIFADRLIYRRNICILYNYTHTHCLCCDQTFDLSFFFVKKNPLVVVDVLDGAPASHLWRVTIDNL